MAKWTKKRTAHLVKRWEEGASGGVIARELGGFARYFDKGRSAVSAKAWRLGLAMRRPTESRNRGRPSSSWSNAAVATLRRRWKRGDDSGQIARALGVSRSAVMGKIRRLGLTRRPRTAPAVRPYDPATDSKPQWLREYGHARSR